MLPQVSLVKAKTKEEVGKISWSFGDFDHEAQIVDSRELNYITSLFIKISVILNIQDRVCISRILCSHICSMIVEF